MSNKKHIQMNQISNLSLLIVQVKREVEALDKEESQTQDDLRLITNDNINELFGHVDGIIDILANPKG